MEIHIWSDFSCPFCYIGTHNLHQAIKRLPDALQSKITIYYRSFELNIDAPNYTDKSIAEELSERYQAPIERAKAMIKNATEIAKEFGLTFNHEKSVPTNTARAHQLQHFVMQNDFSKSDQTAMALFHAYFTDGKNLADIATLLTIAEELELDLDALTDALDSEQYLNQVRDDENFAHQLQIQSVPFFVINQELAIQGSQTIDEFEKFLREELS